MIEGATPRRHRVTVTCTAEAVSTLFGTIVAQVEAPAVNPAIEEGRFQLKFVAMLDDLGSILSAISSDILDLYVVPFSVEEARRDTSKPMPVSNVRSNIVPITRVAPAAKRHMDPKRRLSAAMTVFQKNHHASVADFADAMDAAGYARNVYTYLGELVKEGHIVRVGAGIYRRPTDQEKQARNS